MNTIAENYIKNKINQYKDKQNLLKNEIKNMLKKHKILNKSFEKGEMYFLKHTIGVYATIITILSLLVLTLIKDINKIEMNYKYILILIIATTVVLILGIAIKYEIVEYNKRKLKYNYNQFQIQLLNEEILKYQDLLDSNNNIDDLETKIKSEYYIKLKNNEKNNKIIKFIIDLNGINKKKAKLLYQQNRVNGDELNYFEAEVIQQELTNIGYQSKIKCT